MQMTQWTVVAVLNVLVFVSSTEIQRLDGFYNNVDNFTWGAKGQNLIRLVPAAYADGTEEFRQGPNERLISETVLRGPTGLKSNKGRTAFFAMFGQFVSLESIKSFGPGCPREPSAIPVPKCDADYDPDCTGSQKLPFLRADYIRSTGGDSKKARQMKNGVTSFIDGSAIYSDSQVRLSDMRLFKDGKLRTKDNAGLFPTLNAHKMPVLNLPRPHAYGKGKPPADEHWLTGDARFSQTSAMMVYYILFMRYHNLMADKYKTLNPLWDDEKLFQAARRWVIAVEQKIFAYDFFPAFTNDNLTQYTGYDSSVNPAVSHLHQSAAFRFGHSLVPPGLYRRDINCKFMQTTSVTMEPKGYPATRMCNSWFYHQEPFEFGIEAIILGMSSQITEREDHILVEDVRGKLFGPIQHTRRDLGAMNIKRGRDSGLPDYNTARKALGLAPITAFSDINPWLYSTDPEVIERLEKVYDGNIDNIDVYVGGLFESTDDGPGELFKAIIKDQFTRIRDGDRFWYENRLNGLFTEEEIRDIEVITLHTIIRLTTEIKAADLQQNVLFWKAGDPCEQPAQLNASQLSQCDGNRGYDFFTGSMVEFVSITVFVVAFPLLCVLLPWLMVRVRDKLYKEQSVLKPTTESSFHLVAGNGAYPDIVFDNEGWEYQGDGKWSHVEVVFSEKENRIKLLNKRQEIIRSLHLQDLESVEVLESTDPGRNTMSIVINDGFSMGLNFRRHSHVTELTKLVEEAVDQSDNYFEKNEDTEEHILSKVTSKKVAIRDVDVYMRGILIGLFESQVKSDPLSSLSKEDMLSIELTRIELANVVGLSPASPFIDVVFNSLDQSKTNSVKLVRFLALLVFICNVPEETKLEALFVVYDIDDKGFLCDEEFKELTRLIEDMADNESDGSFFEELLSGSNFEETNKLTKATLVELSHNNPSLQANMQRAFLRLDRVETYIDRGRPIGILDDVKHPGRKGTIDISYRQSVANISKRDCAKCVMLARKFITNYFQHIICLSIFFGVNIGLFANTVYVFLTDKKHATVKGLAGSTVSISRGSGGALSFTCAAMLLSVCKNAINAFKGTFVALCIPLDSAVEFHKITAVTCMFLSVVHTVGHVVNFYRLSAHPPDVVRCAFHNKISYWSELPTFSYWVFGNIIGVTGVLLVVVLSVMTVFSTSWVRQRMHYVFHVVHKQFILVYVLTILHGSVGILKDPSFYMYVMGPVIIYTCDKLYGTRIKTVPLPVVLVEFMPSDVVHVKIKKPEKFNFIPGQFAEIACEGISTNEFHPFTIASAPCEETLSFYIRALGPWTKALSNVLDVADKKYPLMYVHGPFGGVFGDFHKFEVSVMVGGGIGVAAFASILKQLVYEMQGTAQKCVKLYFVWSTKRLTHWEWFVDILREIEENDVDEFVDLHLFVTQHYINDLTNLLLFVGEQHLSTSRRYSTNLYASLASATHFGRADFPAFFKSISREHKEVSRIGVFTSGPAVLTKGVRMACDQLNKTEDTSFVLFYENFIG